MQLESADHQDGRGECQETSSQMTPALVVFPICHEFRIGDGRTLSVASDMARKSPVIITMTISMGVRTA